MDRQRIQYRSVGKPKSKTVSKCVRVFCFCRECSGETRHRILTRYLQAACMTEYRVLACMDCQSIAVQEIGPAGEVVHFTGGHGHCMPILSSIQ